MRFGLFGEQALTLKQVAERLGIGREAVRHIEARAMAVFRHHGLRQAQSSDDATDLIESLGFSERLLNCLKRAQIDRVAKLLTKTEDDLLAITGFGYNALEEVVAKLQDRGLTLRAGGSASPEQKVLSAMRTLGQGGMMAEVAARADLTIPEVVQALNALLKSKSIPRVGSVEVVFGQELTWELVT
ncbi:hypothetical protein KY386_02450 [Candidatus Parcubacteria bacterium]|nr:hypothetical protein [Candidatus Parcubacteria bacterium]